MQICPVIYRDFFLVNMSSFHPDLIHPVHVSKSTYARDFRARWSCLSLSVYLNGMHNTFHSPRNKNIATLFSGLLMKKWLLLYYGSKTIHFNNIFKHSTIEYRQRQAGVFLIFRSEQNIWLSRECMTILKSLKKWNFSEK